VVAEKIPPEGLTEMKTWVFLTGVSVLSMYIVLTHYSNSGEWLAVLGIDTLILAYMIMMLILSIRNRKRRNG